VAQSGAEEMKPLWFLLVTLSLIACSTAASEQSAFQEEADAFCQAHSVDYWSRSGKLDDLNALSPTEKQVRLIEELRSTVTSEEMKEIIYKEAQALSVEEFYPYLQRALPKLTGQSFECPEIEVFYIAQ